METEQNGENKEENAPKRKRANSTTRSKKTEKTEKNEKTEKTNERPTCKPVQICELEQPFVATKNKYGHYQLENGLVIDRNSREVIGRQDEKEKDVNCISIEDIEYCQIHGLRFRTPSKYYYRFSENEKKDADLMAEMKKQQIEFDQRVESENQNNINESVDADEEMEEEIDDEIEDEMEDDEDFSHFA
jgi:hypothetical protein